MDINMVLRLQFFSQTGLPRLEDIFFDATLALWRLVAFFFSFYGRVHGRRKSPLDGILSIHETPGQIHEIENVPRSYIDVVVSRKWVKFHFGRTIPLNAQVS